MDYPSKLTLASLQYLPQLASLTLNNNALTFYTQQMVSDTSCWVQLAGLSSLRSLTLTGAKPRREALVALATMTQLTALWVEHPATNRYEELVYISSEDFAKLTTLTALKTREWSFSKGMLPSNMQQVTGQLQLHSLKNIRIEDGENPIYVV